MKPLILFLIISLSIKITAAQTFRENERVSTSSELHLKGAVKRVISTSYYLRDKSEDTTGEGWKKRL